jgi:O6-methylguanine-DNA--protein-cysteine methyltransferase
MARASGIPGLRPAAAVLGTALVVSVSWRAWVTTDLDGVPVWGMLAVAVAAVPAVLAVNGAEFRLQSGLVGVRLGGIETIRFVSQANVANMLPLPGGPVLRHRVLANRGASQRLAVRVQLLTAIWWLASGLAVSGVALVVAADRPWFGWLAVAGGAVLGVAGWSMRPRPVTHPSRLAWLAVVELGSVIIGAARLWAFAVLLGATLDAAGAMSMAFTTPAAAALGIFPSGIGAREALVAATAELVGVDAALMFLAATLERVMSLVAAVPLLLWSLWGRRHPSAGSVLAALGGAPGGETASGVEAATDLGRPPPAQ